MSEWFTREVILMIKVLNWNPKCREYDCFIPCENLNRGGGLEKGDNNDHYTGFCCSHWEYVFDEYATYSECEVCKSVYWWAGEIQNDDTNPISEELMTEIGDFIRL